MWPVEPVPDGFVIAPHHLYVGVILALIAAAVVWDDRPKMEPIGVVAGSTAALFGFALTWRWYATTGAAITLSGLLVALACVLGGRFWSGRAWSRDRRPTSRAVVLAGVLIALDDVVQHAFGVSTPLDLFWKMALAPVLPGTPLPA